MTTDFRQLSESGGSFVATSENWQGYQRWPVFYDETKPSRITQSPIKELAK